MKPIPLPISELKPALAGLGKIIHRHTTLPVLGYIRVARTPSGSLILAANNLEQAAEVSLDAQDPGEARAVLVPLKDLVETAKRCGPGSTILVQHDAAEPSGSIRYPVGNSLAEQQFPSLLPDEFPPLPQVEGDPLPVPDSLRRSLLEAFQCASTDETRAVLNGAFVDVSDPKCHAVVGTNGRMLYAANSFHLALEKPLLIPTSKFLGWKPFFEDGDWTLSVAQSRKEEEKAPAFAISSLRWRYFSSQIEGTYPNYRQVLLDGSSFGTRLEFEPTDLKSILQTIERLPCHDTLNHTIALEVQSASVSLLGKSAGAANWTAVEVPAVRAKGKDVRIAFNRQFVATALRFGLNNLQIIDAMSPARFSEGGRQMIIMPIRTDAAATQAPGTSRASPENKPTPLKPSAEPPTNERNDPMRNTPSEAAAHANGNGGSTNGNPEPPTSITTALERIETIKGSYREAIRGLGDLADLLRQVQRESRASEKEISSVRQTLRSLQSVRI